MIEREKPMISDGLNDYFLKSILRKRLNKLPEGDKIKNTASLVIGSIELELSDFLIAKFNKVV